MKKAKQKYKKTIWQARMVWRVREVSDDGLLRVPKGSDYGQPFSLFDECSGYASLDAALDGINEVLKKEYCSKELVALPFFTRYVAGEEEVDD